MSADLVSLVKSGLVAELEKLRDQVLELTEPLTELQLWEKPVEPGNSVGHLILHLTGLSYLVRLLGRKRLSDLPTSPS